MTPEKALELLNEAARRAPGNRDEHILWQQAVQTMSDAVIELRNLKTTVSPPVFGQNYVVVEDAAPPED